MAFHMWGMESHIVTFKHLDEEKQLMKITTMLLKASGYTFLVFFQVSSITILNISSYTIEMVHV